MLKIRFGFIHSDEDFEIFQKSLYANKSNKLGRENKFSHNTVKPCYFELGWGCEKSLRYLRVRDTEVKNLKKM